MARPRIIAVVLPALSLVAGAGARAGDEDISPSAYQVFDPETGFMVPSDSLQDPEAAHAMTTEHPAPAEVAGPTDDGPPATLFAGAAVIVVLAAVLLRRRRRA